MASVRSVDDFHYPIDESLRDLLLTLSPTARDTLRRALILDQPDRDAIASELLRYGDANGDGWADVIDTLTMYPDVRRTIVRLVGRGRSSRRLRERSPRRHRCHRHHFVGGRQSADRPVPALDTAWERGDRCAVGLGSTTCHLDRPGQSEGPYLLQHRDPRVPSEGGEPNDEDRVRDRCTAYG